MPATAAAETEQPEPAKTRFAKDQLKSDHRAHRAAGGGEEGDRRRISATSIAEAKGNGFDVEGRCARSCACASRTTDERREQQEVLGNLHARAGDVAVTRLA